MNIFAILCGAYSCDNPHLREDDILNILKEVADDIFSTNKREQIVSCAMSILTDVFDSDSLDSERDKITRDIGKFTKQQSQLLELLLDGTISKEAFKDKNAELEKILEILRQSESELQEKEELRADRDKRLSDIRAMLNDSDLGDTKVTKLMSHVIKIVVKSDHIEIYFDFFEKIIRNTKNTINLGVKSSLKHQASSDKGTGNSFQFVSARGYDIAQTDTYHLGEGTKKITVWIFV